MSSQLVAALLGAVVAFGGTFLLQQNQNRRRDLDGVRERLGLARALRADLYAAKLVTETCIKNQQIVAGTVLPSNLWEAQGHRLIGALRRPGEEALIQIFSRFSLINGIVSATRRPEGHLPLTTEQLEALNLQSLIEKIDHAVEMLDRLEVEYQQRELTLRWPIRSRLPARMPGALRLEWLEPDASA